MTTAQRVIKYAAMAFAIFLVVIIITSILGFLSIFAYDSSKNSSEKQTYTFERNFQYLDIDVESVTLNVKSGDVLAVESTSDSIKVKESNNKLIIEEKNRFLNNYVGEEVVLYVPRNYTFEKVNVDAGAGSLTIDSVNTRVLDLDLGAGNCNLNNLLVSSSADIDAGVGELNINSGTINNLKAELGVGNFVADTDLNGNVTLDAGVGNVDIKIQDTLQDYKVKVNKGIGNAYLNDTEMQSDIFYGNGTNLIKINGGVGEIRLYFLDYVTY